MPLRKISWRQTVATVSSSSGRAASSEVGGASVNQSVQQALLAESLTSRRASVVAVLRGDPEHRADVPETQTHKSSADERQISLRIPMVLMFGCATLSETARMVESDTAVLMLARV